MTLREQFVERFGEHDARIMEEAAEFHAFDGIFGIGIGIEAGSDPFRWAIIMCISFDCMTKFHKVHGFQNPSSDLKGWIRANANLKEYDGGFDRLTAILGFYEEWL